ncbi:hypothetical protein [Croceicoccus bisphenolivorans]|uniref:hypothetical protein n=1 Tax=Croceicoccus bisphenolivorans TaxID=1783232 RepID=UPI0012E885B6|nr:hypothetical protein [Croceicoccus bisphenolivorans]
MIERLRARTCPAGITGGASVQQSDRRNPASQTNDHPYDSLKTEELNLLVSTAQAMTLWGVRTGKDPFNDPIKAPMTETVIFQNDQTVDLPESGCLSLRGNARTIRRKSREPMVANQQSAKHEAALDL